jgi:hypothetical protein
MLAHSPPFPLTIEYLDIDGITTSALSAEDEHGILLALEQRHRVRHLRLFLPVQNLQKLVMAIDEEFPILEYLSVGPPPTVSSALMLPETLQAPNLHHLILGGFAFPIRPRLHPTATGLVTLYLTITHPSAYFQPNVLLQWISFIPQLERLAIYFAFPVPNRDVGRQLTHTPITTPITLPNLRLFEFEGVSAYVEAVVCRIATPRLETVQIRLFKQLTFSVPRLAQFMSTTENLRVDNAVISFGHKKVDMRMFSREAEICAFVVCINCWHLDWQVSSVAQISNLLSQVFSAVEYLTLEHEVHSQSSEEHNDVERIEWRNLFRPFSNVKTVHVEDGLVGQLSYCLRLEDGELPLELLPELQELTCIGSRDTGHGDAFTSFIDARKNADRPVTLRLVRQSPSPSPSPSQLSIEPPAITSPIDEAGNDIDPALTRESRSCSSISSTASHLPAAIHSLHDRDLSTKDFDAGHPSDMANP